MWPLEAALPGAGSSLRPDSLNRALLGCSHIQARVPRAGADPTSIPRFVFPVVLLLRWVRSTIVFASLSLLSLSIFVVSIFVVSISVVSFDRRVSIVVSGDPRRFTVLASVPIVPVSRCSPRSGLFEWVFGSRSRVCWWSALLSPPGRLCPGRFFLFRLFSLSVSLFLSLSLSLSLSLPDPDSLTGSDWDRSLGLSSIALDRGVSESHRRRKERFRIFKFFQFAFRCGSLPLGCSLGPVLGFARTRSTDCARNHALCGKKSVSGDRVFFSL